MFGKIYILNSDYTSKVGELICSLQWRFSEARVVAVVVAVAVAAVCS